MSKTPRTDAKITDKTYQMVPADFARQLESELAEAKEARDAWMNEALQSRITIAGVLKTVEQYERQIAAGELITPQTIHDFLETKHDRWNPLYMADLVKFAAERAKESK